MSGAERLTAERGRRPPRSRALSAPRRWCATASTAPRPAPRSRPGCSSIPSTRWRRRAPPTAPAGPACSTGVPVGVKDVIDTYDMPTQHGSPIYRGNRPFADAACVALTRAAGGMILGKTVTTEFANRHPRETVHPHNPAHTPGGSSSGSAAAVADFQVPVGFGTQTGGSTIRPAAFCGVVGYKPSLWRVQPGRHQDAVPQPRHARHHLPQPRRYRADARGVAWCSPAARSTARAAAPRIGFCRTPSWDARRRPDTQALLEHTAARLSAAGATVKETSRAVPADIARPPASRLRFEAARNYAYEYEEHRDQISPASARQAARTPGRDLPLAAYIEAIETAEAFRAHLDDVFGEFDVLLTPSAAGEAPGRARLDRRRALQRDLDACPGRRASPCRPAPGTKGLPLGVQLVGPRFARRNAARRRRLGRGPARLTRHLPADVRRQHSLRVAPDPTPRRKQNDLRTARLSLRAGPPAGSDQALRHDHLDVVGKARASIRPGSGPSRSGRRTRTSITCSNGNCSPSGPRDWRRSTPIPNGSRRAPRPRRTARSSPRSPTLPAADQLLVGEVKRGDDMLYELRIYHCPPGRLPALLKRFDTITLGIWKRHGIQQAGFWTTLIGEFNQTSLPAQMGVARRAREEMERVPGRPGMDRQARRDRKERPDRRPRRELLPAADRLLGGEIAEAPAIRRRASGGRRRGSPPRPFRRS